MSEQNRDRGYFIPAFHPSLVSKGIDCQLWWYFFLKNQDSVPEEWSEKNLTAMTVGTAIHNELQHVLYKMGILEGVYQCMACGREFWATSPNKQCPNCLQFFKSWDYLKYKEVPILTDLIRGHADGIINKKGARTLLEIKSIKNVDRPNAKYGYEVLNDKPLDEHMIQAQLYLYSWGEIVKAANLGEEYTVDETGKLSTKKLDGPVYEGARIIGPLYQAVIEYVAKNSSDKRAFLVKKNYNSIKFLLSEMQAIKKAYLEDDISSLKGVDSVNKNLCKKCIYRGSCTWKD